MNGGEAATARAADLEELGMGEPGEGLDGVNTGAVQGKGPLAGEAEQVDWVVVGAGGRRWVWVGCHGVTRAGVRDWARSRRSAG